MTIFRSPKRTSDDLVPIFSVESDQLVLKDGRVAVGFSVSGIETEKLTAQQYSHLNSIVYGAIKGLPEGTIVQTWNTYFFRSYTASRKNKTYFQLRTLDHFAERPILIHRGYVFLSFGPLLSYERNAANTFYATGKNLGKNVFEGIAERQKTIEHIQSDFVSGIGFEGLSFQRLTGDEMIDLYLQYYNLEFDPDYQPTDLLRHYSPETTHLGVGEKRFNVITMSGQGSPIDAYARNKRGIYSPWTHPLGHNLYFPHIVSTSIKVLKREKVLKSMDSKAKIMGNLDFLTTQDNKIQREEMLDFTEEVRTDNKTIVATNVSVLLFDGETDTVNKRIQQVIGAFKEMGSAECFVEGVDTANLFIANAPGNSDQNYRWLTMTGDNAAMYVNFVTRYQSELVGDLLCDRQGVPVLVNLFNTELANQNCLVIGPTGSGKSFTMGSKILQRFDRGEPQIIIDVGGTYLSLMTALKGRYFEYDPDRPLKFNPFLVERLDDGSFRLDGDKTNFLTNLLTLIWKGKGVEIRPAEISVLNELVLLYYQNYNERYRTLKQEAGLPGITGFYDWLIQYIKIGKKQDDEEYVKQSGSFNFNELLLCLKPFAHGQYKDILNSDEYEDLSAYKLICFDLIKIQKNALLFPVVAMMITELAADQIARYRKLNKWIYMDEAWSMLSGVMSNFIELQFRTIRKLGGSMTIITQSIYELINNPIGRILIVNAATKVILRHTESEAVTKICQEMSFTHHEREKILSLEQTKDYREIFISQGEASKVFRLEVPYAVQAILTSKPKERETLRDLTDEFGGDISTAIREFVELKKEGKLGVTIVETADESESLHP